MAYEDVKTYLAKMPTNPLSSFSDDTELDKMLFQAAEDLSVYHIRHVTPRILALQALYTYESNMSEYGALRRQGIASLSTKRGSISFSGSTTGATSNISPQVIEIIGDPPATIGRIY